MLEGGKSYYRFMKPIPVDAWIHDLNIDGFTGATPLALQKFQHINIDTFHLLLGNIEGSAGEASSLLILAGGALMVSLFRRGSRTTGWRDWCRGNSYRDAERWRCCSWSTDDR